MSDDVVVPAVTEVRCYINAEGDVVISRPAQEWEQSGSDNGSIGIVIPRLHARAVIKRIQALLKEKA